MPKNKESRNLKRPSPISMRLTERDQKIIVRCFEDKLLSTSFLQRLYFPSLVSCSRRLRMLFSNHYLDRWFFPASPPEMGKKEAYYSVGKGGESLVALKLGIPAEKIETHSRTLKRRIKSYSILFTLAHIKAISRARFSFERAFAMNDKVELISWLPERLLQQQFKDGKSKKLRPDALLKYFTKPNGKKYTAFLEVDLATESSKQIQKKVSRYLAFSKTALPQQKFGTTLFRVIILTTSDKRSKNIKKSVESITDKIFWITDFSLLKGDFLGLPIFLRAGCKGRYPLIEV